MRRRKDIMGSKIREKNVKNHVKMSTFFLLLQEAPPLSSARPGDKARCERALELGRFESRDFF